MEYDKREIKLYLGELYSKKVLKEKNLDSIESSYQALSFPKIIQKESNTIKTMKDVAYLLNKSIVEVSELQDLIEDFQMDLEDEGTLENAFKIPYYSSAYNEIKKINPIMLWKSAVVFVNYMYQNCDDIVQNLLDNYDLKTLPYKYISMISYKGYQGLEKVIKRGIFSALNFKYKEISCKEFIQLINQLKDNQYVCLMLGLLTSNYAKELYILACLSGAVYEVLDENLSQEMFYVWNVPLKKEHNSSNNLVVSYTFHQIFDMEMSDELKAEAMLALIKE